MNKKKKIEWYVYMIRGKNKALYTGITINLKRRVQEHNGLKPGGAKYTRAHRPWVLVYQSSKLTSRSVASMIESQYKSLSKKQKERFVKCWSQGRVILQPLLRSWS